ncbi:RimJ/RimL family protein N-acetyltransferase [Rhodovulum bhavnagarense]|uniref:RimJ/RimL family protein N-acetyltransferase n=1 Tax=Rhodovulum bhavnagarense TaxID=992286 RepID=A0A4R2RCJ2_9RHOB|nr:GNAT family N-acetyltransferase [Rhodovulum bhavnagarense]TCP60523.1 RimJ/RimL family protein N-acetyltransferase [Rhodovulum bhavnagarense]
MNAADDFHIETPRLTLRPFAGEDLRTLARIATDPRVAPMMGTIPVPWPEREMRLWVDRARFRGTVGFRLAIAKRQGGVIGTIGLGGAPASLAYFLDPAHWGRGYATEAARVFLAGCFARFPGLDVVGADHYFDNPASGRVLEKLGFRPTGRGIGHSRARLEPAANIHYRLWRSSFEARHEIP